MHKIITALFISLSAIAYGQDTPVEVPRIAIKAPLGEAIKIDNVSIKLLEVLEDSRCPSDVTCIWAGQAKVKVAVSVDGAEPFTKELLFKATMGNSDVQKTLFTNEEFFIEGMSLTPYPTSATQGKLEYVLLVCKGAN